MKQLSILKPGDNIEIIAPASRCTSKQMEDLISILQSWQLNCIVAEDIFGDDLFSSNSDEFRFRHLKNALTNPQSKAIISARGGYGSMRLIPDLMNISKPELPKLFIGMSDTTCLQLYLQQNWQWPTIHGAIAPDRFSPESTSSLKGILFGNVECVEFCSLLALNKHAMNNRIVESSLTGGNLSLVQTSIGTSWQIDGKDKIILLEEIGERGYRVDRILEHLRQANIFKDAAAIIFGDFVECIETNGTSLIDRVLTRFSESIDIPVVKVSGIGHGYNNLPIPFGISSTLRLGSEIKLTCMLSL